MEKASSCICYLRKRSRKLFGVERRVRKWPSAVSLEPRGVQIIILSHLGRRHLLSNILKRQPLLLGRVLSGSTSSPGPQAGPSGRTALFLLTPSTHPRTPFLPAGAGVRRESNMNKTRSLASVSGTQVNGQLGQCDQSSGTAARRPREPAEPPGKAGRGADERTPGG